MLKIFRWICAGLFSVAMRLGEQNERLKLMSTALINLNNNLATLNVTVAAVVAKLGLPSGVPEADVQAAADSVKGVNDALSAALTPASP